MGSDEPTSITLDILKKIHAGMDELRQGLIQTRDELRHEIGGLREEVRGNSRRLDAVDDRLEAVDDRLQAQGKRLGGVETRMHELVQVTTLSITRQLDLGHRVDVIEDRVAALEAR